MKGWFQGYIAIIIVLIVIMKYINGETGLFLLSFFVVLPVIFLLLTLLTRKNIDLEIDYPPIVSKDMPFEINLTFSAKKYAVACILLKIYEISEDEKYLKKPVCFTYAGNSKQTVSIVKSLEYSGLQSFEVRYFLLDLFQFSFFKKEFKQKIDIAVIYKIPEEKINAPLIRVYEQIQDEPDETETSAFLAKSIAAGYEHRKYEVGDPLKKINWKLSARLGELMTRLDEKINGIKIIFYIDFTFTDKKNDEKLVETALAILRDAADNGFSCEVRADAVYEINSLSDAENMSITLAYIPFISNYETADFEDDKNVACFYFSNNLNELNIARIEQEQSLGKNIQIFGTQNIKLKDYYIINTDEVGL